ncbi:MAG TPA: YraN family protein [Candidatus Limnocylindrales bacterium]|nr:YraN family protein [Candidatus Limnocylindrales bacterium]
MRTLRQVLGDDAEALVTRRLLEEGWSIIGRNVRVGRAEIDILAVDGSAGRGELVAVEVRWRRRRDYGLPEETVDRAKLARLRAAALSLREGAPLTGVPIPRLPVRVDVVAVEPGDVVRHHRAVG